ncbi:MAG: hypothetical protein IKW30_04380 [Lachnospiraceae bacterium]|nr:hypothetical protein [Lachnospiraceae bacterium]
MEERTWRRGQKQTYTDRPLTLEEAEFSGRWENYKKIFEFMYYYKMDEEEWFDILIIPYLQSVKKYHERPDLRANYKFWHVCNLMLSKAVYNHNRAMSRQKRKPAEEILSLDYMMEGDNLFSESRLDYMWIDHRQQTEKIVLDKEMLAEILLGLTDVQSRIFEMLLEGYNKREIGEKLCLSCTLLNTQLEKLQCVVADYFMRDCY